jgi:hypothetical protein
MSKNKDPDRLIIVANLLALQMVEGKSLGDAVWLLKRAGMSNVEIGQVLDISEDSARAHGSKMKRQSQQSRKETRKKVTNG